MDNGNDGLKKTINNLKKYKINHIGADFSQRKIYRPFLFKKNNQKIAIINTSEGEEANEKYNNHIGASNIDSYKSEFKKHPFPRSTNSVRALATLRGSQSGFEAAEAYNLIFMTTT